MFLESSYLGKGTIPGRGDSGQSPHLLALECPGRGGPFPAFPSAVLPTRSPGEAACCSRGPGGLRGFSAQPKNISLDSLSRCLRLQHYKFIPLR